MGYKNLQQNAYNDLGDYFRSIGNLHLASDYYKKIIPIARELRTTSFFGTAYGNLGIVYGELQQFDKAIVCYNIALRTAQELNDKHQEAIVYTNLGTTYLVKSFRGLEKLSSSSTSSSAKEREVIIKGPDKGTLLETVAKSEYNYTEAIKRWEWLFDQLQEHHHFQITFFDLMVQAYIGLIFILISKGQKQQALLYSERARARVLVDLLTTKYGMVKVTTPSLSYSDLETVWSHGQFCILCYSCNKAKGGGFVWILPGPPNDIQNNECFVVKDFVNDPINPISELISRAYRCLKIEVDVKCENRSLEPPESSHKVTSPSSTTTTRGNDSNSNVKPNDKRHTIHPLKKLFTLLVSGAPSMQQEEVVIIPEGPLYTVPFAALVDPNTGRYLSDTKRIRLAPSITFLKRLQECPADYHSKTGALIIGNPDVGQVIFRGEMTSFKSLRGAQQEAEMIGGYFDDTPLIGAQASKDKVMTKLKEGVALIHIAAHGCPENGEIALAPSAMSREGGRIPEEEDYLLTMKEVQETGVRAQLVVLSCCHSGRGEIRAEGVVGLTRAFLAAGARSVVATLWAVNDQAALSFMLSFYRFLMDGKSASASMQCAIKELRREDFSSPRHWGSFILMGDDVTIPRWSLND